MTKRLWLLTLVLLTALFVQTGSAADTANLLAGGDFESGATGQEPASWTRESSCTSPFVTITDQKAHGGSCSVAIKADTACDVRIIQTVAVRPNTFYRFSGWIATEKVTPEKTGAILCIMGGYDMTASLNGTTGWSYVEMNFRTHETQNEIALAARLGMWGSEVTGAAWFDDLSLVELKEAPASYQQLTGPASSNPAARTNEGGGSGGSLWTIFWFLLALVVIGLQVLLFKKKKSAKTE